MNTMNNRSMDVGNNMNNRSMDVGNNMNNRTMSNNMGNNMNNRSMDVGNNMNNRTMSNNMGNNMNNRTMSNNMGNNMNNRTMSNNMGNNMNNSINSKHVLFYSNFCQFSNDIYKLIEKYNLKNNFILINISKKKYKIPSNINSVPTILLNDKKTLIQDYNIEKFLEDLSKETNKKVDPFTNINGISNVYSFLDDNSNKDTTLNFGLIDNEFHIETPPEDGEDGNSASISDKMNIIQEDRNMEIQKYFKKK
jgi:hypothetical protein